MKVKHNNDKNAFTITFGAKFSDQTFIGEDGKEYYRAIKGSGTTITFGSFCNNIISNERGSKEYREFVKNVLKRDNYTCRRCGSTINPVVHHILNYRDHKDIRTNIDNGITLCETCHSPMILGGFHQIYGTYNNTKKQLDEYIKSYKDI